jgi:hypothetical protein
VAIELPENGVRPSRTSITIAATTPPKIVHNAIPFGKRATTTETQACRNTGELASRCVLISLSTRHNISFPLTPPSFTYVFISSFTYLQGSWSNFIYPSFPHFFSFLWCFIFFNFVM